MQVICYLILIILFDINHFFLHPVKWFQILIFNITYSI